MKLNSKDPKKATKKGTNTHIVLLQNLGIHPVFYSVTYRIDTEHCFCEGIKISLIFYCISTINSNMLYYKNDILFHKKDFCSSTRTNSTFHIASTNILIGLS